MSAKFPRGGGGGGGGGGAGPFLARSLYVLVAQKNCLIETVLLSIHNICFGWEIKKIVYLEAC